MNVKLGISAINWLNEDRHLFKDLYTGEEVLSEMSKLGFEGTEMSRAFPRNVHELKALLSSKGLSLASGWKSVLFSDPSRRQTEMKAYREHVDFLKAMGCKHVVTCEIRNQFTGPDRSKIVPLSDEEWKYMVDGLHEAGRYCRENGMELVYHFHGETVVETPEEIHKLVEMTDPELVHLLYDTGHAYYGGSDPLELLKTYYDRIRYIHLKDVRQDVLNWTRLYRVKFSHAVKKGIFTVPGDGCIDFIPIFQKLIERQYEGWLVIEAEQNPLTANPFAYAFKGKQYIEEVIERVRQQTDMSN